MSKHETNDHVGLEPGLSHLRPVAPLDDIVVIDTKSESEADLEETIQVVCLSSLFPGSVPYPNRKRSQM